MLLLGGRMLPLGSSTSQSPTSAGQNRRMSFLMLRTEQQIRYIRWHTATTTMFVLGMYDVTCR